MVPAVVKTTGHTTFHINRWQDAQYFLKKIEVLDKSHNFQHTYLEKVRKFSCTDFIEMLSWQQLKVKAVFGDYTLEPFNSTTSPRMILIARK
ncbi:MAG: hypothetical protein JSS67_04425 [Bacteroidetes bacterium]|nr:hypothetical protein [Bacteroidota bacterium]